MAEIGNPKQFDLEDRTREFAKRIRGFVKRLPKSIANHEDSRQLIRSSGSVAANYIEANESLSKKDFAMRIKISREEAKESRLWLGLLDCGQDVSVENECKALAKESTELMLIFGSILKKSI